MIIVQEGSLLKHCLTCYNWKFNKAVGSIERKNFCAPCTEWSDVEAGYTRYTLYDGYCHEWDNAVSPTNKQVIILKQQQLFMKTGELEPTAHSRWFSQKTERDLES